MKEALHYEKLAGDKVKCVLCFHECNLDDGQTGFCLARENVKGRLIARTYGQLVAAHMDPIEKKPLYHFHPGEDVLSVAGNGCNLACPFCQNREISREKSPAKLVSPEELIALTLKSKSKGIAYTYTEPLVWYEYVLDSARLARENGLYNVIVSNGTINAEPLRQLLPYLNGANIDLKGDETFYRKVLKGDRESTLTTIRALKDAGVHVEVTILLIPGVNDSEPQLDEVLSLIKKLDPSIPLHLSRYYPYHGYPAPATPPETMMRAFQQASARLPYVYVGNIMLDQGHNTLCPDCGTTLVDRLGYRITLENIQDGNCASCGRKTDIIL